MVLLEVLNLNLKLIQLDLKIYKIKNNFNILQWILNKINLTSVIKFVLFIYIKIVLATSFNIEDQIILQSIVKYNIYFYIISLNTNKLFLETNNVYIKNMLKFNININMIFPSYFNILLHKQKYKKFSIYNNINTRLNCCEIRKIYPLKFVLKKYNLWITGLRKFQSNNRFLFPFIYIDKKFSLIKLNPLLNWSNIEIYYYIYSNYTPINNLIYRNFKSIGCNPCTKTVKYWESERSGRWWWEKFSNTECGLHTN